MILISSCRQVLSYTGMNMMYILVVECVHPTMVGPSSKGIGPVRQSDRSYLSGVTESGIPQLIVKRVIVDL